MPNVTVAGCDCFDACVAMVYGQVERYHAIAVGCVGFCEGSSVVGGGVCGSVPSVAVASSQCFGSCIAIVDD